MCLGSFEQETALRGCALAMQRQYAQAIPTLQRAADAVSAEPRYQSPYESLTAMRVACLALSGRRAQAVQAAKTFNRETAKLYAEQYPRPAIIYGILLGLNMPEAAFTPAEVQRMLQYEDPAYEVRFYAQHLRAYQQIQKRQYRPALTSLQRAYTDPKVAVAPGAPEPETMLLEAYLHQQLKETAKMQARLKQAQDALKKAIDKPQEEQRKLDHCTLILLGRLLFPKEWKL
jgi:hypothetical protein